MSIRNLEALFEPQSVALIGASERVGSLGRILLENLQRDFSGTLYPVNPGHAELLGQAAYADVAALPGTADLAIIATPPATIPQLVDDLARKGTRGICVITAGLGGEGEDGSLRQAMLDAARPYLVRIIGPNCVGLQVPALGLNASFASVFPAAGSIAFVAQSGAVITAVLDWAYPRGIGFSHVVSLGDMADVDFGDMLDYLANDPGTESILLYIEAVTSARKFLSAARAAARTKPVIVVKGGRELAGARAAASHTGALAGADAVYDAAFRRSGMLRVLTLEEHFEDLETLARVKAPPGDDLTILTNGGGLGVLAADALVAAGGSLTDLSEESVAALDAVLPPTWSHGNPIDIIGDATGERYAKAIEVLLGRPEVGALLILNCPTALASSDEVADALVRVLPAEPELTILTSWTGQHSTANARARIADSGIASYDTPEDAIQAFMQMVDYRKNQDLLRQTPPSLPEHFEPQTTEAQAVIDAALAEDREWLTEPEAKAVIAAYGIETVATMEARSPAEVTAAAEALGDALAIKILSPDITHKTDVGGVALSIAPADAGSVAAAMLDRVRALRPDARVEGFTVQRMVPYSGARELIVGMIDDQQFGPVMLFGQGGTAVEIVDDKALALPPLNLHLAHEMIARTRIHKLLQGYRGIEGVDIQAIAMTLVRVSQLISDLASVQELDINPLLATPDGVIALDARIRVAPAESHGAERLAIRPYPKALETTVSANDGRSFVMRPVMPEDDTRLRAAFPRASQLTALRMTQIDYDRQMLLVITDPGIAGSCDIHAAAYLAEDPDRVRAVLTLAVGEALAGQGLGTRLADRMLRYAEERGVEQVYWHIPRDDSRLLRFSRACGFVEHADDAASASSTVTMVFSART